MRALAASIAVHATALAMAWWLARPAEAPRVVDRQAVVEEPPTDVELIEQPSVHEDRPSGRAAAVGGVPGSSGRGHRSARSKQGGGHAGQTERTDPWNELALGMDDGTGSEVGSGSGNGSGNGNVSGSGNGNGSGNGSGNGNGNGVGFGDGGGIARMTAVPRAPAPPVSKARPAKLLQPSRDLAVEDDDHLFIARITVDEDGDVVAVRMTTTHPGVRGDQASSAIWSFRYAPALDDDGVPIRSTFEQPFQVR